MSAAAVSVGHLETGRSGDVGEVHPDGIRDCERRDKYDPYGEGNDPRNHRSFLRYPMRGMVREVALIQSH